MKKKVLVGLLVTFVLSLAVSAYAFGPIGYRHCPLCGYPAEYTGRTSVNEDRECRYEFRCSNNHYFYVDR